MKRHPDSSTSLRARVLWYAIDVAASEGLEGMTIGQVATASSRFKSGITLLFGNKVGLQLAVLDEAQRRFDDAVFTPAERYTGTERLRVLVEGWMACASGGVFPRGCFLLATLHEMDARPGTVRDAVAAWNGRVHAAIAEAAAPCLGDSGLTTDGVVTRVVGMAAAVNFLVVTGHRERALRNGRQTLAILLHELAPHAWASERWDAQPPATGMRTPDASSVIP